jgi:hypothetical protein
VKITAKFRIFPPNRKGQRGLKNVQSQNNTGTLLSGFLILFRNFSMAVLGCAFRGSSREQQLSPSKQSDHLANEEMSIASVMSVEKTRMWNGMASGLKYTAKMPLDLPWQTDFITKFSMSVIYPHNMIKPTKIQKTDALTKYVLFIMFNNFRLYRPLEYIQNH